MLEWGERDIFPLLCKWVGSEKEKKSGGKVKNKKIFKRFYK